MLRVLEDKEHKEYTMSILSVLEKVNRSLFNPTLVSIANDKKKVEKRIRGIKNMKLIKNKQFTFTVVGILAVIIVAPMVLTTANKDTKDSGYKEVVNQPSNEIELNEMQKSYRDIVEVKQNGVSVGQGDLKNIV